MTTTTVTETQKTPSMVFKLQYPIVGDECLIYNEDKTIMGFIPQETLRNVELNLPEQFEGKDSPEFLEWMSSLPEQKLTLLELLRASLKLYVLASVDANGIIHIEDIVDDDAPVW